MNLLDMNPHDTRYIPLIGSPIGGSTASFLYNKIFAAFGINAMSYPVEVKKGELSNNWTGHGPDHHFRPLRPTAAT